MSRHSMHIAIGLPNNIPGVNGAAILDWARRADAGLFSSVCVIDRLVYDTHESLITLAAAASVTRRVRLMTTVLVAPLRNAAVLAKQAATLDSLSGGRLTLGLGISRREDDYRAASVQFSSRGKHFEAQLALMKRIWSGQKVADDVGPIGPTPARAGGPELLIGGSSPAALRRVGQLADGYMAILADPPTVRKLYHVAEEAWKVAGRAGKPRFVGGAYFGLGRDAVERGASFLRGYYAGRGPLPERMARSLLSSPEAVREVVRAFSDIGMDEFVFWPTLPDQDQVERLADVVG